MFNLNRSHDHQNHLYQEALHTLLYNYPNGLSAVEIADKLRISPSECDKLLKIEQIRDTVDADPLTGTLIFKTKILTTPINSLDETLKNVWTKKMLSKTKTGLTLLSASLFSCTLISISINIFVSFGNPSYDIRFWRNDQSKAALIKTRIEDELAKQKKLEKLNQIDDLNRRREKMRSIAEISKCNIYWNNSQTCYIEGRLLTRVEFDRELDEMKRQIDELKQNND